MYKDVDYARMRLNGTIIRHNAKPVYIQDVWMGDEGILCSHRPIAGTVITTHPLKEYDLTPLPLGNVNYRGVSSYMSRLPLRHDWRQGSRGANTRVVNQGFRSNPGASVDYLLKSKSLSRCIENNYPTFEECLDTLGNEEATGVAFSKVFNLTEGKGTYNLYYKGLHHVGSVHKRTKKITLNPEYHHLAEVLEESVNENDKRHLRKP